METLLVERAPGKKNIGKIITDNDNNNEISYHIADLWVGLEADIRVRSGDHD